jgi:hypothetical protein
MNENYANTDCGLPVPSDDELFELQSNYLMNPDSEFNLFKTATEIIFKNPAISEIIREDIHHWQKYEAIERLDAEEIKEYSNGICSGYAFFIGATTLIGFIRSEHQNINDYLSDTNNGIPILNINEREKKRINDVRKGNAIIEILDGNEDIEDSSDLAFVHAGQYIFEAVRFEQLLNDEMDNIDEMLHNQYENDCDGRVISNIDGFKHGVANAIEMYMQIEEERIIERLEG